MSCGLAALSPARKLIQSKVEIPGFLSSRPIWRQQEEASVIR